MNDLDQHVNIPETPAPPITARSFLTGCAAGIALIAFAIATCCAPAVVVATWKALL